MEKYHKKEYGMKEKTGKLPFQNWSALVNLIFFSLKIRQILCYFMQLWYHVWNSDMFMQFNNLLNLCLVWSAIQKMEMSNMHATVWFMWIKIFPMNGKKFSWKTAKTLEPNERFIVSVSVAVAYVTRTEVVCIKSRKTITRSIHDNDFLPKEIHSSLLRNIFVRKSSAITSTDERCIHNHFMQSHRNDCFEMPSR